MTTKAKTKRKQPEKSSKKRRGLLGIRDQRSRETPAGSPSEEMLRSHLVYRRITSDTKDDKALHDWIASMKKPMEDPRTPFERGIQNRLARELGITP